MNPCRDPSGREKVDDPPALRIGLHSGQQYPDFASLRTLWHTAESLGYDWVSLFEHFRPPIFGADGPCLDGMTALSALAAVTPRVRCAMLVSPVTWRHPALLAIAAATVDQVSGGRLELGLGAGGDDLAFAQYGIEQPPPRVRLERLDEACRIVRALWEGGPVDFAGEHFTLRGAHLNPRPVQHGVPLVIGGRGPHLLRVAAEHADVWNCLALEPASYAAAAATLDEHCARIGRAPSSVRRSVTFRAVITADARGARQAREAVACGSVGHPADLAEYIGFGTAQQCLDRLAPYVELGVRDFLLGVRPPLDFTTVERFATEVAPALRELA
ncbi:LLM class flavin-dependent oxidoreductase [Streptomyces sp. HF10]|uniref:LLM class flavin-dependent oxidoreductase n=1 Tax=Streptomyces sp. HF10 TaxID=2692233 RepID=UPI001315BAF5|nr:LLM class flavin-dependent oxidoreductase [Streptomyces sp. HF10]QHC31825.1 LLM class flavin-dependent oxidoreductase [Streptomyces sp. HF10]